MTWLVYKLTIFASALGFLDILHEVWVKRYKWPMTFSGMFSLFLLCFFFDFYFFPFLTFFSRFLHLCTHPTLLTMIVYLVGHSCLVFQLPVKFFWSFLIHLLYHAIFKWPMFFDIFKFCKGGLKDRKYLYEKIKIIKKNAIMAFSFQKWGKKWTHFQGFNSFFVWIKWPWGSMVDPGALSGERGKMEIHGFRGHVLFNQL